MRKSSLMPRRTAAVSLLALGTIGFGVVTSVALLPVTSAFASTQPYELYCPGTPVGTIALNNVVTDGTITPSTLSTGTQFHLTDYQTQVTLPPDIVNASAALGNTAVTGTASATVDATGATPSSISSGTISFDAPIPSPVPAAGISMELPATASTLGPFTATGGAISLAVASTANLSVAVTPGSTPLSLTCKAYANDAIATAGITTATPSGSLVSPVIATATASSSAAATTTTTTTAPTSTSATTATTAPPTAASSSTSSSTAFTGVGPDVWLVAFLGLLLVLFGLASFLLGVDGRGPLRQALKLAGPHLVPGRFDLYRARAEFSRAIRAGAFRRGAPRGGPSTPMSPFGAAGSPPGLWLDADAPPGSAAPANARTPDDLWIEGWAPDTEP